GLDGREVVAFVVSGAAGIDVAAADRRLERWRLPFLHRVYGLDVVVAIDGQIRLARAPVPLGGDHREPAFPNIDDLRLHIHRREAISQPARVARASSWGHVSRAQRIASSEGSMGRSAVSRSSNAFSSYP